MDPLLLEEAVEWGHALDWDFGQSAEAIRRCVDSRDLSGCALLADGEVVGYGYTAVEDGKGLVGDVYVRPHWRNGINEVRLFRLLLGGLTQTPGLRRIESQMMLVDRSVSRDAAADLDLESFPRMMMTAELTDTPASTRALNPRRYRLDPWGERHFEAAAGVITLAYEGHVDSRINDQYLNMAGARKFLRNILRFPSLGMFFAAGSFVAADVETDRLSGVILVSLVGDRAGHITQVCVVPGARAAGVGSGLLSAAMSALGRAGIARVSLAVTDSNRAALELYRRAGFVMKREFAALVSC